VSDPVDPGCLREVAELGHEIGLGLDEHADGSGTQPAVHGHAPVDPADTVLGPTGAQGGDDQWRGRDVPGRRMVDVGGSMMDRQREVDRLVRTPGRE
jgi:hypothetical protein